MDGRDKVGHDGVRCISLTLPHLTVTKPHSV
jgi:hypothetical protein